MVKGQGRRYVLHHMDSIDGCYLAGKQPKALSSTARGRSSRPFCRLFDSVSSLALPSSARSSALWLADSSGQTFTASMGKTAQRSAMARLLANMDLYGPGGPLERRTGELCGRTPTA